MIMELYENLSLSSYFKYKKLLEQKIMNLPESSYFEKQTEIEQTFTVHSLSREYKKFPMSLLTDGNRQLESFKTEENI